MARCTPPVDGHRTARAAANCPACGSRSYYTPPTRPSWSAGGGSSTGRSSSGGASSGGGARRAPGGGAVSYTAAEWQTIEPLTREADVQAREHPERRDLFLCHAWDDRQGAARDL